jgi:hypothetical protein
MYRATLSLASTALILVPSLAVGADRSTAATPAATTAATPAATVGVIRAAIDNASYSWWIQPVAVNDGADTWVGGIARLGTVRVAKVRPTTGAVEFVEISRTGRPDDHNAPALAFDSAQPHLVVFYAGHNADSVVRYRTVNRTTLAVGPERQLAFSGPVTYAQVLRSGTRLALFTRVGSSTWRYRISDDFGGTWGPERAFMDATGYGQVYLVVKPVTGDADTNLLAFYGHPVNSTFRDVVFARLHLTSGTIERANGTAIGNLGMAGGPAFRPGDLEPVITPSSTYRVRLLDIGTVAGQPALSYAVWQGTTGQAQYKTKRYRAGVWSTPPWSLASGDPFGYDPATHYLGGAVIGRDDRLYTARKHNATGTWYVERWRWSAGEDTYLLDQELARDAQQPLVRPYVPARPGETEVIVQRLERYDGYTAYDADTLVL